MSMVRFLVYSNQFDVEGLIATTSTWMGTRCGPTSSGRCSTRTTQVRPKLLEHEAGFPTADALRAVVVVGTARLRHGRRRAGQDDARRRAHHPAAERTDPRPLWVLAWGGANTLAQALMQARATRAPRAARRARRQTPRLRDLRSGRRGAVDPPGVPVVCTTSASRQPRMAISITSRRGPASAAIASTRTRRRRLHDVQRRMGECEHPQQGPARQALSDAVLHSRRRHALVPRLDQQRPGERHEPDLRRVGRPLRVAHVSTARRSRSGRRAATRSRDATTRGTPWPASTARRTRRIRRRSGVGARRSSTTSPRGWTGRSRT